MKKKHLFNDRDEWRAWLEEQHQTESEVWLIYYKKHTDKQSIRYECAVEEALCFGWIDSKVKRIDEEKYMQRYTPRKELSNWSESNKKRVRKLIANGLMTQAGLEVVEIAKRNGSWNRLDDIDKELVIPGDLEAALAQNPKAEENFSGFAPSHKKQYLWWLKSAKRAETRERRIREIVKRAEENIKPGI
ncbi:MAG: YdeI/OmpD-associated family protein [Anaerolineales bacterium]